MIDQHRAHRSLAVMAGGQHAVAPAHHYFTRDEPEQHQRQAGAKAEDQHGDGDGAEIFALCRQHGGGAERRTDAGAPDRAEQQPDRELAAQACGREAAESLLGPVAHRAGSERELLLELRHHKHDADADQEERGHHAEHVGIEPDGEADCRHDQPDHDEGERKPGGKRDRPRAMLGQRGAEHDRQQRQHAGRERGQDAREECQRDGGHGTRPSRGQSAFAISASIEALLVSPVERATSLPPL